MASHSLRWGAKRDLLQLLNDLLDLQCPLSGTPHHPLPVAEMHPSEMSMLLYEDPGLVMDSSDWGVQIMGRAYLESLLESSQLFGKAGCNFQISTSCN
jgi:hypothetical protein